MWFRRLSAVLAVVVLAGCGSLSGHGGTQATASCYVGYDPQSYDGSEPVDVTFDNPTGQAISPEYVEVVTFDVNGMQDWSDSDWGAKGYLLGFTIAPGQSVTYQGNDAAWAPPGAVSCKVVSWQAFS